MRINPLAWVGVMLFVLVVWPETVLPAVGLVLLVAGTIWAVRVWARQRRWVR